MMSLPRLFHPFQRAHGGDVHRLLSSWFQTDLGAEVLQKETAMLGRLLPSMFGYYLVQAGVGEPQWLAENSVIHRKLYVCEQTQQSERYRCVCSRLDDMAIATESVDVAILHHCLDFEASPHRVLREVSRVVIPGGKIIIVGFNPWSLWGLSRFFMTSSDKMPWSGNFLSPYRISDWLNLLDFQVEGCESVMHGMPSASTRTRKLFGWLEFAGQYAWRQHGGVYVLVATKQVSTLTPIKPKFKSVRDSLVHIPIAGIAKPSTRKLWSPKGDSKT